MPRTPNVDYLLAVAGNPSTPEKTRLAILKWLLEVGYAR